MKKITENTKVTLTLSQLKKLVKEGVAPITMPESSVNPMKITWEPYDGHKMVTGAFYLFAPRDDSGVEAYVYDPRDQAFWDSGYVLAQEVE